MRLLEAIIICITMLCGCRGAKNTAEIDRALRALDSAAIAAAGIDTTTLDATEKQVLRHLLAGAWINADGYDMPSFEPDEAYYLAVQDVIAAQLREQGYVPPTAEQFSERIQTLFGIAQGDEPQHLHFDGEKWASLDPAYRYALDEGGDEGLEPLHFDPKRRQITTLSDLPTLVDYRNRYPQLAAVEQHIDSKKRLQLLLDRREIDPEVRERYSLVLFADADTEWVQQNAKIKAARHSARNKFLLNGYAAGFQHMLRDYDPLVRWLWEQGGMRKPEIRVGRDIGELFQSREWWDSMIFSLGRPEWEVRGATRGDLNGDGQDDLALVIGFDPEMLYFDDTDTLHSTRNSSRDQYGDYPDEALRSRTLIVALSEKNKQGLPVCIVHEELIPCLPAWNSSADDAFEGIQISDGRLTLHERSWMSAGSWWTGNFFYIFEYVDSQLRLTGYKSSEFHRTTGEGTSTTLDIKRGLSITGPYNISDQTASAPVDTLHFTPRPLIPLEKLERGGEYTLSESDSEDAAIKIYLLN